MRGCPTSSPSSTSSIPRFRFLGTVPLDRLLRSKRPTPIEEIISEAKHSVQATDDQEDVARLFERYNLLSVGVVDEAGRLVGVITIDDIVDIIEEEADEDIKRLAGVGDEEISEGVFSVVRLRSSWLLVNLVTAFLSASVIGLFEDTIERIAILAMLFPIVAGARRQCRHADADGHGARARHAAAQHRQHLAADRPRGAGRHLQRRRARLRHRRSLVG